ncbi:Methylamine utilization protein MauG [Methanosarcinales archaeon]|nr:Methylamine utilization protein MauG [Methanosarcinales archaeon]
MLSKRIWICAAVLLLTAAIGTAAALTDKEQLGKHIFYDKELSINENQACAACHAPQVGFTGPDSIINVLGSVYEGSISGRFGNRKPPTAAYADSPVLNDSTGIWIGGMFWDGRASGWILGDPLAEQAKGPFLNPMEQGLPNASCVVYRVIKSEYASLYKKVWDNDVFSINWPREINKVCSKEDGQVVLSPKDQLKADTAYNNIARAVAAYERSKEVSPFTSKYDDYLKGKAKLTRQEKKGLDLFNGDRAKCANCHVPPLFTDFSYDNLGIPKNLMNPFYYEYAWNGLGGGLNWVDMGLGGFLATTQYNSSAAENNGKHKVPTLRNVDKRPYPSYIKDYGHNGYFKSLKQIVHFYNTRDVPGATWNGEPWPAPEVPGTINNVEMGDLGLTSDEEDDIVAFLKTLTDRNKSKEENKH